MAYGIKLHVWGDYACFTRPEMKVERVSYDVITPSAARGILDAIHWKPAIRWVVDRIQVLNEIRFENIRRNEIENKIAVSAIKNAMAGKSAVLEQVITEERQQRATLMLKNPAYIIHAHFEMTAAAGAEDSPEKHYNIFLRRARQGQCFHRPYLGCREFAAQFALIEDGQDSPIQSEHYADSGEKDLGWMLHDIDFSDGMTPRFFRASMRNGFIEVPEMPERK
ncbi:type I-C CRISPR-associated protein Cas5c [Cohnella boryungensis]|uniref:pre-crRNA processing endonuclease n=1 Tax=Cohnella boryungensis TaxID=768479 RepID=A0ABV8SCZ3_9BACL